MATPPRKVPVRTELASSAPYRPILVIQGPNPISRSCREPAIPFVDIQRSNAHARGPLRHNAGSSAEAVGSIVGLDAGGHEFAVAYGRTPLPR